MVPPSLTNFSSDLDESRNRPWDKWGTRPPSPPVATPLLSGTRRLATVTRSRISFRALTKTFSFSRRRSRPRTKFTLQITMLIDYCLWYYVRACRRDQAFVDAGILWKYAPFNTCYYAKFGRSRSNGTRVITEIRHKHLTPRVLPFNVTQSHRIDRLPVISY